MRIRPANAADAPAIAAIHIETWRAAYRGQIPDALLDALDMVHSISSWRERLGRESGSVLVAENGEGIVGFCCLIPSRDRDADPQTTIEIAAIYIQPRHWRQGAGRALSVRAFTEARRRGCETVTLWSLASNDTAKRFYETMGFRLDGAAKTFKTKDGTELPEVRFRITLRI